MSEEQLNITEYAAASAAIRAGSEPSLHTQTVILGDAEEQVSSKPIDERCSFVRLLSTVDCRISFRGDVGDDSTILPAGIPEYFGVRAENGCKITVVKL